MRIPVPEGFEREQFIKERLRLEENTAEALNIEIRESVLVFLKQEKGYLDEDIETDGIFQFEAGGKSEKTSVDFILRLGGKRLISIKCAPSSLESRERHILAFGRVVDSYVIPISVVTSGTAARILDTVSGELISEDIKSIPSKSELLEKAKGMELKQYPAERLEKEKRILLAFDGIRCSIIDF